MGDPHTSLERMPGLRITRTADGDATILILAGDLDVSTAPMLRSELDVIGGTVRQVVVEMTDVAFLDSSGLGALIGAQRTLANDFCQFAIRNPSPSVRHVLEISGVAPHLHIIEASSTTNA